MYDYHTYEKDQFVNWISNFLSDWQDHEYPYGMPFLSEWEVAVVIMAVR